MAAFAERGLLKERPGLDDVVLDDDSEQCRATCNNEKRCRNRVHENAGQTGHCEGTCGLHKNLSPDQLLPRDDDDGQHKLAESTGKGAESDADVVASDSDTEVDEDDLFADNNVNAAVAAGMGEKEQAQAAAGAAVGASHRTRGSHRDLLSFFNVDGGTTSSSCNLYTDSDGKPVPMCCAFTYAYRDCRLRDFTPTEFRSRSVSTLECAPSATPLTVQFVRVEHA